LGGDLGALERVVVWLDELVEQVRQVFETAFVVGGPI
jgi:hypothetical protein